MTHDIRWQQRFENLSKAKERLDEAIRASHENRANHLYQIALVGAFNFTFELSWKTLKDYLTYNGVDVSLPRDVIKQAFHHQLIEDGQIWIDMLGDRNLMAHVYDEAKAIAACERIRTHYAKAINQVYHDLKQKQV